MENSTNHSNKTINLESLFLSKVYTTWLIDLLNLALIVPLGVVGTFLNCFGFILFQKSCFQKIGLFKYMKVCCLVSLAVTICLSLSFYLSPHLLYDLALSYAGRVFKCYVLNYVVVFLFFYQNVLEVLINLERVAYFGKRFECFKKVSPYGWCLICLIVCAVINGPNFFSAKLVPTEELYVLCRLCVTSDFSSTNLGKISLLTVYIVEGPVVLTLVISSNLLAFSSYRLFLKRKATLIPNNSSTVDQTQTERTRDRKAHV